MARSITCDACGKNMMDENGNSHAALRVSMYSNEGLILGPKSKASEFDKEQFGPYEGDRCYEICYECWLKSLGVRP